MQILEDGRQIKSIWTKCPDEDIVTVGRNGVTRIEVYGEPDQGVLVPWLKIWKDDFLSARFNVAQIATIQYAPDQ